MCLMYIMLHKRNVCLFNSESVMHYGAYDFSKNGQKTIVRLDGSEADLGNEVGFSQVTQSNSYQRWAGPRSKRTAVLNRDPF